MEIVAGIILVLSLFGNHLQANRIDELEQKAEILAEIANDNAAEAHEAAEAAEQNGNIASGLSADLNSCVQKLDSYAASQAIYDRRRQADAVAIAELESRLRRSSLERCSVPSWLVDRYAGPEPAEGGSGNGG